MQLQITTDRIYFTNPRGEQVGQHGKQSSSTKQPPTTNRLRPV